jgi:SAM-dependent methyltransferase
VKRCLSCERGFESADWTCPACGQTPRKVDDILTFAPELAAGTGIDASYRFDALQAAEASHFWFRNRAALILWAIRRYYPESRSLLDVGCGSGSVAGAVARALPAIRVTAGEILLEWLRRGKTLFPGVDFLQLDIQRLPFRAEFDLVGAFDVLEHLDDDVGALEAMRDAVRRGGAVLITVPQHPSLWSEVDDFSHHRRRYTRPELADKLRRAGFSIVRMTSFASAVLPMMLVSRRLPKGFDPERELRVPALANRLLSTVSSFERRAIAAGFSLPVGGSLLALAVRTS